MPTPTRGYPVTLDVSRRLSVIVGGGRVGARKARGLLEAGAGGVRVVSVAFAETMPEGVERVGEAYHAGHLEGAGLVFAATDDPVVNRTVVADARARGVWVNRADHEEGGEEEGDFSTPAAWRAGELTVTVSAGGSPALAAVVRDAIAKFIDPRLASMAGAMKELRPRVLASGWPIERRRAVFRMLAGEEALGVLEARGVEGVWEWVVGRVQA